MKPTPIRKQDDEFKFLSLGAGVQSSTIFLMSCYGEIERIDAAVFADTGWEPREVYNWLEFLKSEAIKYSIPIYTVHKSNIRTDLLNSAVGKYRTGGQRWVSIPFFTKNPINGSIGRMKRQCTSDYKIRPLQKKFRELAGYKKYARIPIGEIEVWKGISTDERKRATLSKEKWISSYYPLLDLGMSRLDCLQWFKKKGLSRPPRSSCLGCTNHTNKEWRHIKNSQDEWNDVVEFDRNIRKKGGIVGDLFLHRKCIPINEVDLRSDEEKGQLSLWTDECMGVCGV